VYLAVEYFDTASLLFQIKRIEDGSLETLVIIIANAQKTPVVLMPA
jgi:hypothetical protein